jgi:hypothetical protein
MHESPKRSHDSMLIEHSATAALCNEIGGHLCSITCPATQVPYDLCITYFETVKAKSASRRRILRI